MLLTILLSLFLNLNPAHAASEGGGSSGGHYGIALTPNIPHVLNISYETINRGSHLTYSFGAGYVPPITISTATVSTFNIDARVRWHPFGGAFLLGLSGGYHSYSGSGSTTVNVAAQNVSVTIKDTLSGGFITPHVGWMWFFGKLIVGLEVGSQTGIGSSNSIDLSINDPTLQSLLSQVQADPTYQAFQTSIDNSVKSLTSLPYVGFKLGWMF